MIKLVLWIALVIVGIAAATLAVLRVTPAQVAVQRAVRPGHLSAAHASLENNCSACHTSVAGPDDRKCIGCHANETALLQRQPTAFHATIGNCSECHIEHGGVNGRLTKMNHIALAKVGMKLLSQAAPETEQKQVRTDLLRWVRLHPRGDSPTPNHPNTTPLEMTLDCQTCHATKDRHVGFFGADCAQCHATVSWRIAEFQHPSPRSFDCAQCHQAPPSHYMMHFDMISKKVAGQEDAQVSQCCGVAQVNQCYRCHQTTSWNDIKGVGYYKHH